MDGALPVDYGDGSRGVFTLCGTGDLSDGAFDTAAELLAILPEVLTVIRERRALALVNASNVILHAADPESGTQPLPRERLHEYFGQVCAQVSEALQGAAVSLYLKECERDNALRLRRRLSTGDRQDDTDRDDGRFRAPPGPGCTTDRRVADQWRPRLGNLALRERVRPARALDPVRSHRPASRCRPARALLGKLANRRAIFEENESWRQLANGITEFNKILTEALRKAEGAPIPSRRWPPLHCTWRATSSPASSGTAVYVAPAAHRPWIGHRSRLPRPPTVRASAKPDASQAETAYRSLHPANGAWHRFSEVGDGSDSRWIVSTPICVGHQAYGALAAEGPGPEPPANSAQVYEILSDQLGLYRHLAHTMDDLKTVQRELKTNLTDQAEAMEDLKHQLVSPLRAATDRTDLVLSLGRFDAGPSASSRRPAGCAARPVGSPCPPACSPRSARVDCRTRGPNCSAAGICSGC